MERRRDLSEHRVMQKRALAFVRNAFLVWDDRHFKHDIFLLFQIGECPRVNVMSVTVFDDREALLTNKCHKVNLALIVKFDWLETLQDGLVVFDQHQTVIDAFKSAKQKLLIACAHLNHVFRNFFQILV